MLSLLVLGQEKIKLEDVDWKIEERRNILETPNGEYELIF